MKTPYTYIKFTRTIQIASAYIEIIHMGVRVRIYTYIHTYDMT